MIKEKSVRNLNGFKELFNVSMEVCFQLLGMRCQAILC